MSHHILYIEDYELNIEIARMILEMANYKFSFAQEGKKAILMAEELQPDLILMDYHLPGMTGLEVTRSLKSNKSLAHIPIIALTADIYSQKNFLEAGCSAFISKPIRRTSLLRIVKEVLTGADSSQSV